MTTLNYKDIKRVLAELRKGYENMSAETDDQKALKNNLVNACDDVESLILSKCTVDITAEYILSLIDNIQGSQRRNPQAIVLNWVASKLNLSMLAAQTRNRSVK